MDTRKIQERPRRHRQALSSLETVSEEEPIYVFDNSDTGKWVREEAVVDSGAVECVTSKKRMPG